MVKPGPTPKTLLELLRSNGYRGDRHVDLLRTQPLPEEAPEWADPHVWKGLLTAQRFATRDIEQQVAEHVEHLTAIYAEHGEEWTPDEKHLDLQRRSYEMLSRDYEAWFSRAVRALHGGRLPWALGGP